MRIINSVLGAILGSRRLMRTTATLGLLVVLGFAQYGVAQTPTPLGLSNNYMVTGDYVVGGVGLRGLGDATGFATGTITIPDAAAYATGVPPQQVPPGADVVAAFLYWQTVESTGTFAGQNGFFRGYPITGDVLGNPNAPVSWSSGGCAGSSLGSKTIVAYRADVSNLIPVDANGNVTPNTPYAVRLADSGKSGSVPFTLGATLVIVYRTLAPTVPLNAVVIYDGAYAPSNSAQTMSQPMLGFFQAGNDQPPAAIATKITHIVGNGQSNKIQQVFLNNYSAAGTLVHSTLLPSLYGTNPPFAGNYNGSWDNPTWFPNAILPINTAVLAGESSETTVVVPSSSNKGCVSWGAVILSTTVQDSDHDGLLNVWKTNKGYCDAGANRGMSNQGTCPLNTNDPSWVALPGAATPGTGQDVFIQLDYMCTKVINNANGTTTCDPTGVSYKPDPTAITNLQSAFSLNSHNVSVHVLSDDNNVILAQTCSDTVDANGNPVYCPYPGQAGVVGWKAGFSFLKGQPLNYPDETSCDTRTISVNGTPTPGAGPFCVRRFPSGQNNSYHEAIFGVARGTPDWNFQDGSLTSIRVSGNTLTLTTLNPHGLVSDPTNTGIPNGRITIAGAISNRNLNNTYLVQSVPTTTSFTIQVASGTTAPTLSTDPFLSVGSGVVGSASGVSDLGGADSLISLGLWGADGRTVSVESGTFMHELGHTFGLPHGGLFRTPVTGGYAFSLEPNCKSNYQSVMNYMFQVDLLDGVLDYSEQVLNTLNESAVSTANVLANAMHPTTQWYAPNQAIGTPAKGHCDGTRLLVTDPPTFRRQGPAASIAWSKNQDINFDGQIESSLQGFNDWASIDLRQIGATGNDFWAGGGKTGSFGGKTGSFGGKTGSFGGKTGSFGGKTGSFGGKTGSFGGIGEITTQTANSYVRNPSNLSATLTASNTVLLSWTPPGFGQSLIAAFNIYRSIDGAAFSLTYPMVPVSGTIPPPLPNQSLTDTKVGCHTYSYEVTTVLTDGRESVPSNTAGPISVPCTFVGFLSPLSTASHAPAPPTFSGPRNLGNAVPIKWELLDANGMPIGDLTTLKIMQACPATGATSAPGSSAIPPCVLIYSPVTGGEGSTTFRFSAPTFIINWDTGSLSGLAPGYWTIELQLSDGRIEWTNLLF